MVYALLDAIVDYSIKVIAQIEEAISAMEEGTPCSFNLLSAIPSPFQTQFGSKLCSLLFCFVDSLSLMLINEIA
jgi:hypothetical protein